MVCQRSWEVLSSGRHASGRSGLRASGGGHPRARALVVATGAGMGVDSGLPDFRGDQGFWNAYPVYERLGLSFVDAANPDPFDEDPAFGWGAPPARR